MWQLVTLSPMPGFRAWLLAQLASAQAGPSSTVQAAASSSGSSDGGGAGSIGAATSSKRGAVDTGDLPLVRISPADVAGNQHLPPLITEQEAATLLAAVRQHSSGVGPCAAGGPAGSTQHSGASGGTVGSSSSRDGSSRDTGTITASLLAPAEAAQWSALGGSAAALLRVLLESGALWRQGEGASGAGGEFEVLVRRVVLRAAARYLLMERR